MVDSHFRIVFHDLKWSRKNYWKLNGHISILSRKIAFHGLAREYVSEQYKIVFRSNEQALIGIPGRRTIGTCPTPWPSSKCNYTDGLNYRSASAIVAKGMSEQLRTMVRPRLPAWLFARVALPNAKKSIYRATYITANCL